MNKRPNIGDRVRYPGGHGHVGPRVGVVSAIYPTYEWVEENDREGAIRPEREWRVAMQPDSRPDPWCYGTHNKFAPTVSEIKKAQP